jgi:hypothetical protein
LKSPTSILPPPSLEYKPHLNKKRSIIVALS